MDAKVEKELDTIKKMVCNWYDFYLRQANGHEYDHIHVEEFDEIVSIHVYPYLTRLEACKYINRDELADFYLFLATKRQDLELEIAAIKPEEKEDPVVTLVKDLDLTEAQRKALMKYLSCGGNCKSCKLTAAEKINKGMNPEIAVGESDA
jgi:hypothetical protein